VRLAAAAGGQTGAALLLLFRHAGRISLPANKPTQLQPCVACDERVSELPRRMMCALLFSSCFARAMDGNTRPLRLLHGNIAQDAYTTRWRTIARVVFWRNAAQEIGQYARCCTLELEFTLSGLPALDVRLRSHGVIIPSALRKKLEKQRCPRGMYSNELHNQAAALRRNSVRASFAQFASTAVGLFVLLYDSNERSIVNDEAEVEQCIAHSEELSNEQSPEC